MTRPGTAPLRNVVYVALIVVLTACGREAESAAELVVRDSAGVTIVESAGPAWSEAEAWRLSSEPVVVIGALDGGDRNLLLDPTSVDEDGRGRILVGDGDQAGWDAVLVFDSDGDPLFRAGGEGEGPGEFGQLWWAETYRGDSIVAFDMARDRVQVFGPEGEPARFVLVPRLTGLESPPGVPGYTGGVYAAYPDGSFLAYSRGGLDVAGGPGLAWYRHLLLRLAPDGERWDTLGTFPIYRQYWDGHERRRSWYAPEAIRAVHGDQLYFGAGDVFELRVHGPAGGLRRIIRRVHQPRSVTDADIKRFEEWYLSLVAASRGAGPEVTERVQGQLQAGHWPEVLPAYSAALVDPDGNLWVEEYRWTGDYIPPDLQPAHWSVFDPQGTWLGRVEVPARFILKKVTRERAYGIVVDELDVEEVHAYRIIKP